MWAKLEGFIIRFKGNLHIVIITLFLIVASCQSNRLDVSVENDVTLNLHRLEHDLFDGDLNGAKVKALRNTYAEFFDLYTTEILPIGDTTTSSLAQNLRHFVSDSDIVKIQADVAQKFGDFSEYHSALNQAFGFYHHHFPQMVIPKVVTYISGFNYAVVTADSTIGLGLDMYLGKDYSYYNLLQYPEYKKAKMNPDRIICDAMYAWISTSFDPLPTSASFLQHMLHHGKHLYLLEAMLRNQPDSALIGFTQAQVDWCKANEANMWAFFIQEELLYSQKLNEILKFTNEAPFTSAFGRESPPKTGRYIGWQIIRKLMNEHPEITLLQLMEMNDEALILNMAKYKPKA